MKYSINSRKLGRKFTFSIPGNGYIFVDIDGRPGTLGAQICSGGYFLGSTLAYNGDSQDEFERICNRWYQQYLRGLRNF